MRPVLPCLMCLSLACAGPPAPRSVAAPPARGPSSPAPPPATTSLSSEDRSSEGRSYQDRAAAARAELGDSVVAERTLSGPDALHLVLEASRCYAVVAVAERHVEVSLRDEHGHEVGSDEGPRAELRVCPRWTGSFVLSVRPGARGLVYVAAPASGELGSSTAFSAP